MACERIGNAIVCGRGVKPPKPPCAYCGEPSTRLCDEELRPGLTCDVPMCDKHTTARPKGKDYCRSHKAAHPLSL